MNRHLTTLTCTGGLLAGCLSLTTGCSNQQMQQDQEHALDPVASTHATSMASVRGMDDHDRHDHGHDHGHDRGHDRHDEIEHRINQAVDARMHELGNRLNQEFQRRERELTRRFQE